MRSSSSRTVRTRASSAGRGEAERVLAGVRVGDAVCDGARRAGARREGETLVERGPLGRPVRARGACRKARVEVQDAVADDVEAEVARLDHTGVDRADCDLVGIVAADRAPPSDRVAVLWSTSGRSGSWPSKPTPYRSWASRSSHPAAGTRSTIECTEPAASVGVRLEPVIRRAVGEQACARAEPSADAWSPAKRHPSASAAASRSRYVCPVAGAVT